MRENTGSAGRTIRPPPPGVTCCTWSARTGRAGPDRTYTTPSRPGRDIVLSGNVPVQK